MSAINASGVSLPAARCRLLGPGAGVEDTPRWAWPVLARPSSRAVAESRNHDASTPSSTTARGSVATPSASNGRERKPRRRSGSSSTRMPGRNSRWPSRSLRKLVLRATAAPLMALARWPTGEPAGAPPVEHHGHPFALHLARIEPLDRALAGRTSDLLGRIEVGAVERGGVVVIALHGGALAGDRRHRHALARTEIGAAEALA